MNIWSKSFWKGAGERALKTFIQTYLAVLVLGAGADGVGVSLGVLDVDWLGAGSVALLAAIVSLGTSLGNTEFVAGRNTTPSEDWVPDETELEEPDDLPDDDPDDYPELTEVTYAPVAGDDQDAYVTGGPADPGPRHG